MNRASGAAPNVAVPYRPRAAPPLAWPRDFGPRFTVFVDTEEEFDWSAPFRRDAAAVSAIAAVPGAHGRFAAAGVGLTWLVDHPVARDAAAVATLAATLTDGRSAIGAQLHPWVNPPYDEELSGPNSFAGNLPHALEAAKLDALTDLITTAFGARPLVYRAGRYGLGPDTWTLLAERGYRIDTSPRARYDYSALGGPDFGQIGNSAFRTPAGIVELPFTTMLTGRLRSPKLHRLLGRLRYARGAAARLGVVRQVSLTPEDVALADALEAIAVAHGEGLELLTLSFHSPSLAPGHTPYVRDAADLARFWHWWDGVLAEFARRGIANASLADILAAVD